MGEGWDELKNLEARLSSGPVERSLSTSVKSISFQRVLESMQILRSPF